MSSDDNDQNAIPENLQPVGYGHPPKDTRFKKGQSGNPRGRRKGSHNVASVFARTLREKVVINEQGQRKQVTKLEAAVKQFVNKAASGDLRALQMLVALAREAEATGNLPSPERPEIGEIDQKVLQGIFRRFKPEP
jgi:hypothetical protein